MNVATLPNFKYLETLKEVYLIKIWKDNIKLLHMKVHSPRYQFIVFHMLQSIDEFHQIRMPNLEAQFLFLNAILNEGPKDHTNPVQGRSSFRAENLDCYV